MYGREAVEIRTIPQSCQLYLSSGCAFVLDAAVIEQSKTQWTAYLNTTAASIRDNYVVPINQTINYLAVYAGPRRVKFLPMASDATLLKCRHALFLPHALCIQGDLPLMIETEMLYLLINA